MRKSWELSLVLASRVVNPNPSKSTGSETLALSFSIGKKTIQCKRLDDIYLARIYKSFLDDMNDDLKNQIREEISYKDAKHIKIAAVVVQCMYIFPINCLIVYRYYCLGEIMYNNLCKLGTSRHFTLGHMWTKTTFSTFFYALLVVLNQKYIVLKTYFFYVYF